MMFKSLTNRPFYQYSLEPVYQFLIKQKNQQHVISYLEEQKSKNQFEVEDILKKDTHQIQSVLPVMIQSFVLTSPNSLINTLTRKSVNMYKHVQKYTVDEIIELNNNLSYLLSQQQSKSSMEIELTKYVEANNKIIQKHDLSIKQIVQLIKSLEKIFQLRQAYSNNEDLNEQFNQTFELLENQVLKNLTNNYDELEKIKNFDPFLLELQKLNKNEKWKQKPIEFQEIYLSDSQEEAWTLNELLWLFFNQHRGSSLFYFTVLKYAFESRSIENKINFIFFLAYIDKTVCFNIEKLCQPYLSVEYSKQMQFEEIIKILFYLTVSNKTEPETTEDLIIWLNRKGYDYQPLSNNITLFSTLQMMDQIYRFEQPYLPNINLPEKVFRSGKITFYQLYNDPFSKEIENFLKNNLYIYQQNWKIGLWEYPFVFEHDKSVVLPFTEMFYLGKTSHQIFWTNFMKRNLREYTYKMRIVDWYDYKSFQKRSEKDSYFEKKLSGLQKQQKPMQDLYYNF